MTRKITIAVCAAVLVGAIALFAAEKAREKSPADLSAGRVADKTRQDVKAFGEPKQKEGLLDQLTAAYQANDREKMGEIIKQMQERREGMRKLAKLNKWHQWAHRRWAMAGPPRDWQRGPGGQGGWGNQMPCGRPQWGGAPCQTQERRGCCCGCMGGRGARTGGPAQMRGWAGRGMPGWEHKQMRGGDGFGPGWGGPAWRQAQPRGWDMPAGEEPRTDVPPPDWGW